MIKLTVKTKYLYYFLARWIITVVCSLPITIYGLYILIVCFALHSNIYQIQQIYLFWTLLPLFIVNTFFLIFGAFYKRHLNNSLIYEFYEIVSFAKLPKKLPKIVYVYTTHNDLYRARVLQNAQQTYKNFEVWISEGSEKPEVIESTKRFAKKHNIKFYAVGGKGSSNKADNLNAFIKHSGAVFDYLLITDSDEVLNKRFAEFAVRCFYSNRFTNLGFVSAWNYCYQTDNLFSNIMLNTETISFREHIEKNYTFGSYCNLYSASSLVSKTLLDTNKGLFPNSCNEDYFMESFALRSGFTSIMLPNAPCSQGFDASIKAYHKRTLRIRDWIIKLLKDEKFNQYNEKYVTWWSTHSKFIFESFIIFIKLVSMSVVLWLLIYYHQFIFSQILFLSLFIFIIITLIISTICHYFIQLSSIRFYNKFLILSLLFNLGFNAAIFPYVFKGIINAFVLGKYSAFGGSGKKIEINSKFKPIKWDFILFLIFSCLLIILTLLYVYCISFSNPNVALIYVVFAVILGYLVLGFVFEMFLYLLGLIPNNKNYSKEDFVKTPEVYEFKEIKKDLIKKYKNNKDFDLTCVK